MRDIADPKAGFYKRRLIKNGPWVTVLIRVEGGEQVAEVDGETHRANGEPFNAWDMGATSWPIDEPEYRYLVRMREWVNKHAPHMPQARPREPINLSDLPPRRRP
jgi:hypothetical protein